MTTEEVFEYIVQLPDDQLEQEAACLVGFDKRYQRTKRDLEILVDPKALLNWSEKLYGTVPPIFRLVSSRSPLFLLHGDVGTGKTAFARCASSRLTLELKKKGTLFALSTRVRGSGAVGEASSRINAAFDRVAQDLGNTKLVFLLVDEADSLLTSRHETHSHLEDKVAVNTIIQKVDDLRRHGGRLVVFLATNRVQIIDPAILRRAAVVEEFLRPSNAERRELLMMDLAGLDIMEKTFEAATALTGARDGRLGYTFSDFRVRLLPRIVAEAYPDRKIRDEDVLVAIENTQASESMV